MPTLAAAGRLLVRAGAAGTLAGAGLTAYALAEARAYTLRRVEVPLLPAGARPLRVLHLSDIHMTPGQRRKQEWLAALDDLEPDLVINTGDNLAHRDAVPVVRESLGGLLDRPGVFVFGSNDYFAADPAQPAALLDARRRLTATPPRSAPLPWPRPVARPWPSAGWVRSSPTDSHLARPGR